MNAESTQPPKHTIITIEIAAEDAERIEKAFAEGKLADLGVVEIRRVEQGEKRWTAAEAAAPAKSKASDSPRKPRTR